MQHRPQSVLSQAVLMGTLTRRPHAALSGLLQRNLSILVEALARQRRARKYGLWDVRPVKCLPSWLARTKSHKPRKYMPIGIFAVKHAADRSIEIYGGKHDHSK